jgi:exonuclease SbcC
MDLNKLTIKNFKGIGDFAHDFNGSFEVFGDNGTGKTSIKDAVTWLWTDKISIAPHPKDKKGNTIPRLKVEVEAQFDSGCLKKTSSEVWENPRGGKEKLIGHTQEFFINDEPLKKKEYTARIGNLFNEKIFRILSDPNYFCGVLHWKERRDILLDFFCDLTDEEIIKTDSDFKPITGMLEKISLEGHIKKLNLYKKNSNKELAEIPIRINENLVWHDTKVGHDRVESLKKLEKELSENLENIERDLYLIESFTRKKIELVEAKINSRFKLVRFKMFEPLFSDDEPKEYCIGTYAGVDWNKGLNTGFRSIAGLDVIKVLQKQYGKIAPIFVDDSNLITKISAPAKTQMVILTVSKKDK